MTRRTHPINDDHDCAREMFATRATAAARCDRYSRMDDASRHASPSRARARRPTRAGLFLFDFFISVSACYYMKSEGWGLESTLF